MKKYFAWVFFVLGVINVFSVSYRFAVGGDLPPDLVTAATNPSTSNVLGVANSFFLVGVNALCFYLWYRWK